MNPVGGFFIGVVASFVLVAAIDLLEHFRVDDPIGAVPVHMAAGIWGTMSLGLFAAGAYGTPTPNGADTSSVVTGLFYGGGLSQFAIQTFGTLTVAVATLAVSFVLMYAVKATGTLRVSREGELEGLDIHEHGAVAYPDFALQPRSPIAPAPALARSATGAGLEAAAGADD